MVRALVIASLLAACGGGSRGPAWPKPSPASTDGGESLAPRRISPLAVDDVPSDDIVAIDPITEKPIIRSTPSDDGTEAPTPAVVSPDIIINAEDIVIDVDELSSPRTGR